jgi:simple sugar transport system ATP-binding protein
MSDEPLLEMRDIVKTFPGGVVANDEVDLTVRRGEIHGLLGENGAGKSTLMRILYGLQAPDSGEIRLRGTPVSLDSPQAAIDAGIGMVHQHFMLVPRFSVLENVILGNREPSGRFQSSSEDPDRSVGSLIVRSLASRFTIGRDAARQDVRELAKQYGINVDVDAKVSELSVGEQQRVEILKALYRDIDLLILDEPTAALTPNETEQLFETLRRFVDEGLSIIFITHKLEEITAITDRVTVLKDGATVAMVETAGTTRDELARKMVGRDVVFTVESDEEVQIRDPLLTAESLTAEDDRGQPALRGIDLDIREREVVGVVGVSGNGQTELVECLAGLRQPTGGMIRIDGKPMGGEGPRAYLDAGVSFIPEDRLEDGCAPDLSVVHNAILRDYRSSQFDDAGGGAFLDYDAAREYAEDLVEEFDVRCSSVDVTAGELSGGNLQKLILARELSRDPDVLLAHQPTRGVDVGAIEYIRELLLEQRKAGTGVLLISESLDEVLDLSDRLVVIYEGNIVHRTTPEDADRRELGLYMTGGKAGDQQASGAANSGSGTESDTGTEPEAADS